MKEIIVAIGDKEYKVLVAETQEEKTQGLSEYTEMPSDGMLFDYSSDLQNSLTFNTIEMNFPIDIIFINDDDEVVAVEYGEPHSEDIIECIADEGEKLKYVLELNANSGIKVGDDFDIEEDISDEEIDKMYILDPEGNPQGVIIPGARIFSRKHTKALISKAKKANKSKSDSDYKKLAKLAFKILNTQENQDPEYTELKEKRE